MSDHKTDFERIKAIASRDCVILEEKGKDYGDSWKRRGGVGAFMVTSRKWDRLETICERCGYDIFEAGMEQDMDETVLDTISDLRAYLLLIEERIRWALELKLAEATVGYVDQD